MAKKKSDNASWLRPLPEDFAKDSMSSKKRMIFSSLIVFVLAGFGVLVWLSYTSEVQELGPVPVVRADDAVVKKKPEEPGGKEIPFQDKEVFSRVDNLPAEEENIIASSAEIPLKRPVAEEVVQDDENEKVVVQTETAEVVAKIEPAAPPPPTVAKTSGDYMIQIGAFAEKSKAEELWSSAKNKNARPLAGLQPVYTRVDLGDKGVLYRVRGGMIESRKEADDICALLKKNNQGCIVVSQ